MPQVYQKEQMFFNPRSARCSCCLDCYHCGRVIVVTRHALPTAVKADQATAQLKDGVLTITIPKGEHAKMKEIPIKT
jgi:hypothetical protein